MQNFCNRCSGKKRKCLNTNSRVGRKTLRHRERKKGELKDRTGSVLVLNVSGAVALMLIGKESGVSCWPCSTRAHTVVFTLCDSRAWGVRSGL